MTTAYVFIVVSVVLLICIGTYIIRRRELPLRHLRLGGPEEQLSALGRVRLPLSPDVLTEVIKLTSSNNDEVVAKSCQLLASIGQEGQDVLARIARGTLGSVGLGGEGRLKVIRFLLPRNEDFAARCLPSLFDANYLPTARAALTESIHLAQKGHPVAFESLLKAAEGNPQISKYDEELLFTFLATSSDPRAINTLASVVDTGSIEVLKVISECGTQELKDVVAPSLWRHVDAALDSRHPSRLSALIRAINKFGRPNHTRVSDYVKRLDSLVQGNSVLDIEAIGTLVVIISAFGDKTAAEAMGNVLSLDWKRFETPQTSGDLLCKDLTGIHESAAEFLHRFGNAAIVRRLTPILIHDIGVDAKFTQDRTMNPKASFISKWQGHVASLIEKSGDASQLDALLRNAQADAACSKHRMAVIEKILLRDSRSAPEGFLKQVQSCSVKETYFVGYPDGDGFDTFLKDLDISNVQKLAVDELSRRERET